MLCYMIIYLILSCNLVLNFLLVTWSFHFKFIIVIGREIPIN